MRNLHSFSRGGVVAIALVPLTFATALPVAALATHHVGAVSSSDTTARTSTTARSYATAISTHIAVPSGAVRVTSPPEPLQSNMGTYVQDPSVDLTRFYLLPASFGVVAFAKSHFASDQWMGTGGPASNSTVSVEFSIMSLCPNRHASFCAVTYSSRTLSANQQELRVDVVVEWMPIDVVLMPVSGVVSVTGFKGLSLSGPSTGPVTVTLTSAQAHQLRADISTLRESPPAGCQENTTLYRIAIATNAGGKVMWSAVGTGCISQLTVLDPHNPHNSVVLNAASCPLAHLVTSFFPASAAPGTREGLKYCQPSQ